MCFYFCLNSAAVASNIMSKYGWKEGQGEKNNQLIVVSVIYMVIIGLGRQSQGMSTALAVEKTSKRGGKIINVAAERGCVPYIQFWVLCV